jgi:hypothetical protein
MYLCVGVTKCVCGKFAQNVAKHIPSLSKLMHNLNQGKMFPKNVGGLWIFKKMSEENNRPNGENSPNLVARSVCS